VGVPANDYKHSRPSQALDAPNAAS